MPASSAEAPDVDVASLQQACDFSCKWWRIAAKAVALDTLSKQVVSAHSGIVRSHIDRARTMLVGSETLQDVAASYTELQDVQADKSTTTCLRALRNALVWQCCSMSPMLQETSHLMKTCVCRIS